MAKTNYTFEKRQKELAKKKKKEEKRLKKQNQNAEVLSTEEGIDESPSPVTASDQEKADT